MTEQRDDASRVEKPSEAPPDGAHGLRVWKVAEEDRALPTPRPRERRGRLARFLEFLASSFRHSAGT